MANIQDIIRTVHDLSHEEKVALRNALDADLLFDESLDGSGAESKSALIGLFADDPDTMDRVMESVYEGRQRPFRAE
jgi:hypothetical protein